MFGTPEDVYLFLEREGALPRLINHLKIVGEVGETISKKMKAMDVSFDQQFVRLGIAVHDAGKVVIPEELSQKGNLHEDAGEELLLKHGVEPRLARCCKSHAQYTLENTTFEELLVALSDKLWKGKRDSNLELLVVDRVAALLEEERWSVFDELDTFFEKVASDGHVRLARSVA